MSHQKEFDQYAKEGYEDLIDDPIKQGLCGGADYFLNQKISLIKKYLFKKQEFKSYLDLGCGEGNLCHALEHDIPFRVGIEVSKGMVKSSQSHGILYDGQILPFQSNSFDLITCACVYHHVLPQQRAQFTEEVYRVLKPGGTFAIFEHNPYNPLTKWIVSRTPVDEHAVLLKAKEFQNIHLVDFVEHQCYYYLFFPKVLDKLGQFIEPFLYKLPLGGQYLYISKKN